jgi:hypothetical protein
MGRRIPKKRTWPMYGRVPASVAIGANAPTSLSPEAGPSKDSEASALRNERPGLLAVLDAVGRLPSLTVVTGLDERGAPVLLPLKSRQAWNLLVTGPASFGKSDWLRALALSLPLTSPPERLQLFGVDLTGRQLGVLEALPNSAGALATNIPGAHELLLGLSEEMDRRIRGGAGEPDLVLVIDDLGWEDEPEGLAAAGLLGKLWVRGWQAGIHVLAAGIRDPFRGGGVGLRARAVGWPGRFELVGAGERALVRPCTLSARDLDLVVRRLRGRQGGQAGAEL